MHTEKLLSVHALPFNFACISLCRLLLLPFLLCVRRITFSHSPSSLLSNPHSHHAQALRPSIKKISKLHSLYLSLCLSLFFRSAQNRKHLLVKMGHVKGAVLSIERRSKTKIMCTLGPVLRSIPMIEKLLRVGMNVARFKFSHRSHDYHQETLNNLRQAMENTSILYTVMLNTGVQPNDERTLIIKQLLSFDPNTNPEKDCDITCIPGFTHGLVFPSLLLGITTARSLNPHILRVWKNLGMKTGLSAFDPGSSLELPVSVRMLDVLRWMLIMFLFSYRQIHFTLALKSWDIIKKPEHSRKFLWKLGVSCKTLCFFFLACIERIQERILETKQASCRITGTDTYF